MKKQENLLMKGKWLTGALVLAMAAVTLAGCGAKDETKEKVGNTAAAIKRKIVHMRQVLLDLGERL